jgi:putative ABC transport system permease protein
MLEWRSAYRSLTRRPALSLTIVLTLGLGIGANSAIFSAVDAILLKPLPYPDAERLIKVYELNKGQAGATQLVAPVRIEEWNSRNRTLEGIAGSYFENLTDTSGTVPERVEAMRTSPRFFLVLGVQPALGRLPTLEEELFGGAPVAVLSDGFWRARFGGDPAVIGRSWTIGNQARTIVAVMPPWMRYPTASTEVWLPVQASPRLLQARQARFFTAIARLKPAVTIEQATADLDAIQARAGEQFPETDKGWGASLVPLKEESIAGVRRSLWLLLAAVALVLFAACGNVACLMLADATRRGHEIAVRLAIGARRAQVISQLLLEGALLAGAGAVVGLILAYWGTRALRTASTGLPSAVADLGVDVRLVLFTLLLGCLATLLFALAPAFQATRRDPSDALTRGGRGHVGGHHTLQRALVAAQVGLAIVLLIGAGLLIRSFAQIQTLSPGLDPRNVLAFRMSAQWTERYDDVIQRHARTIHRLEMMPGVRAAAFGHNLPTTGDYPPSEFRIVGRDRSTKLFAHGRAVSANYFRALHIPIFEGNTCSANPTTPPVLKAIVSRSFVDRFFPAERAIGQALAIPGLAPGQTMEIVGIAGDVRERGILKAAEPLIYYCGFEGYWPDPYFIVSLDPARPTGVPAIRQALREIEPSRAMYSIRSLEEAISRSLAPQRMSTMLLASFAATALALASMGLYGVLAQLVAARRREIGVRLALGAEPKRIVRSIARQAVVMTLTGIAGGLLGAAAATRFMSSLVFDVPVLDPVTFVTVPLIFSAAATAAALVPARRASRIDPAEALRE